MLHSAETEKDKWHNTMKAAHYRKINDGSHNSSTYHKKDGTAVRAKLKQQMQQEVVEQHHACTHHQGCIAATEDALEHLSASL